MDLSRRSFLQSIGLGSVAALTLPKPLKIIAATLRDIEGPPLMAAFGIAMFPENVEVMTFKWTSHSLNSEGELMWRVYNRTRPISEVDGHPGPLAAVVGLGSFCLPAYEPLEIWLVADQGRRIPPPSSFEIHASGLHHWITQEVVMKDVRLDRARAIELGLSKPDEPVDFLI